MRLSIWALASSSNLIEVNQAALDRLSAKDARKGSIIELLVFGGLTYEEAAAILGISEATLHRDLKLAKAWLYRELQFQVRPGLAQIAARIRAEPCDAAGGHSAMEAHRDAVSSDRGCWPR